MSDLHHADAVREVVKLTNPNHEEFLKNHFVVTMAHPQLDTRIVLFYPHFRLYDESVVLSRKIAMCEFAAECWAQGPDWRIKMLKCRWYTKVASTAFDVRAVTRYEVVEVE